MKEIIKNKLLWVVLVLAAGVSVGAWMLTQSGLSVETASITPQTISDTIRENGVIETGQTVSQIAQVSGTVQEVYVKENQAVKAGDALVRMQQDDLVQELAIQQSVLRGYEAQLDSLSRNCTAADERYQKYRELYQLGGISQAELEQCEIAYLNALAQFQQAESAVESQKHVIAQLNLSLNRCTITATVDGIVTSLPAAHTAIVQAGQEVATLLNQQGYIAVFDLLYSDIPLLQIGDTVALTAQMRSGDIELSGTIVQINDFAEAGMSALGMEEHRVKVTVAIGDEAAAVLKNGYEVQGSFCLYHAENVLAVPNSALYKTNGSWYVFTVQDGHAVQTPVEPGYQAMTMTEIKSGLSEHDVIIKNANTEDLADGVKVKSK